MSVLAEDLIDVQLAFALSQKPHRLDTGEQIATLVPIMNLETGEQVSFSAQNFEPNGYVFWWSVPSGTWQPGDIVIGTIERSRGYQDPQHDWYQVHSTRGSAVRREVFDSISVSGSHPDGYRWLIDGRHRFKGATAPNSDFYVWTNDELLGPFHAADVKNESGKASFICAPSDSKDGVVTRYPHFASGGVSEQSRRIQSVTISMNDSSPGRHSSVDRIRQYCLIRGVDLERWSSSATRLALLPDELIVSRACKRIVGRSKRREAREQVEALLNEVKDEDSANENAVQDGLVEMLAKVKASESVTNRIVEAVVQSGEFESRIETAVAGSIKSAVLTRVEEIEEQAQQAAAAKIAELNGVEQRIQALRKEKAKIESGLFELEEKRAEDEMRAEELLAKVNMRLQTGRDELLCELALLGPVFQNNGSIHAIQNGQDHHSLASPTRSDRQSQPAFDLSEQPSQKSKALSERQFVDGRLRPCLANHGCATSARDTEFFHVALLGSRMLGLPHPGWAGAYASAMGGTASLTTVSASPKWLDFDSAFEGVLSNAWRRAVGDPSRLHLIVLEGIDRCPSHAWLRPWMNILAGWSKSLPDADQSGWPDHIRLCVTEEKSKACFDIPAEVRHWILAFEAASSDDTLPEILDGHLPLETWQLESLQQPADSFDGFIKGLDLPVNEPFTPMRTGLAGRMRDALMRLGDDELSNLDGIVSRRLFRCWQAEEAK